MNNSAIRASKRKQRNQLSADRVASASIDIGASVWRMPAMSRARRIAGYFAVGGEVDCGSIFAEAWRRGRSIYLPVLHGQELRFAKFCANSVIFRNRFGIPEPASSRRELVPARAMDVILLPLVAFDASGNRIGMGAGFYDRTLRILRHTTRWQRPRMIGLAYEFQKAPKIKAFGWDVPLHHVVTECASYNFSSHRES